MIKIEAILEKLEEMQQAITRIEKKQATPRVIYAKEISELYHISLNSATELCKKYGCKIGRWCIESDKLKELLQTKKHL